MNNYKLLWDKKAWKEYNEWYKQDKKKLKRINELIHDTLNNPYDGIGKPELLKGNLSGKWSRRIDKENRIVYKVNEDKVIILKCKTHYGKN